MAIDIVDLPIKKCDFHSYVSLPEGTCFHDGFSWSFSASLMVFMLMLKMVS
jgi:hypothetical protein